MASPKTTRVPLVSSAGMATATFEERIRLATLADICLLRAVGARRWCSPLNAGGRLTVPDRDGDHGAPRSASRTCGSCRCSGRRSCRSVNRAATIAGRTRSTQFHVAVVGEFKRGKSTLINALLGVDALPSALISKATDGVIEELNDCGTGPWTRCGRSSTSTPWWSRSETAAPSEEDATLRGRVRAHRARGHCHEAFHSMDRHRGDHARRVHRYRAPCEGHAERGDHRVLADDGLSSTAAGSATSPPCTCRSPSIAGYVSGRRVKAVTSRPSSSAWCTRRRPVGPVAPKTTMQSWAGGSRLVHGEKDR